MSNTETGPRTELDWRVDEPEPCAIGPGLEVEISALDHYGHTTIAVVNDDNADWLEVAALIAEAPRLKRQRDKLLEAVRRVEKYGFLSRSQLAEEARSALRAVAAECKELTA